MCFPVLNFVLFWTNRMNSVAWLLLIKKKINLTFKTYDLNTNCRRFLNTDMHSCISHILALISDITFNVLSCLVSYLTSYFSVWFHHIIYQSDPDASPPIRCGYKVCNSTRKNKKQDLSLADLPFITASSWFLGVKMSGSAGFSPLAFFY